MIKNLSQLKKALVPGAEFQIIAHNYHPKYVGQIRKVNIANTMGLYSIVPDKPLSKATQANFGKGVWLPWGKATEWEFGDDGAVTLYERGKSHTPENTIMIIRVREENNDEARKLI